MGLPFEMNQKFACFASEVASLLVMVVNPLYVRSLCNMVVSFMYRKNPVMCFWVGYEKVVLKMKQRCGLRTVVTKPFLKWWSVPFVLYTTPIFYLTTFHISHQTKNKLLTSTYSNQPGNFLSVKKFKPFFLLSNIGMWNVLHTT